MKRDKRGEHKFLSEAEEKLEMRKEGINQDNLLEARFLGRARQKNTHKKKKKKKKKNRGWCSFKKVQQFTKKNERTSASFHSYGSS